MRAVLLDTGPVVGIISDDDVHHRATIEALRESLRAGRNFCTTWEVVGEAYTLMRTRRSRADDPTRAQKVLRWARESTVTILGATEDDHRRTADLLDRHSAHRLSYVDALTLAIAERHRVEEIVTVDGGHFPAVKLNPSPTITVV